MPEVSLLLAGDSAKFDTQPANAGGAEAYTITH
jgi:hypothetical protein